jgi:hypothetical protein
MKRNANQAAPNTTERIAKAEIDAIAHFTVTKTIDQKGLRILAIVTGVLSSPISRPLLN